MTGPRTFYQYQLRRLLGAGWLGPVHEATDPDEGREVALRILEESNAGQAAIVAQLERVLIRVGALQHAHILPTEPLVQQGHQAYYVMTLARQGSLRQVAQQQGRSAQPIPIVTAVELARQAAAGLAYAHGKGLMHGNLKPENLLLQPGRALLGQTGYTVQLSDFGLAELRIGQHGTHDRAMVNTLAYTSPEQCRGIRNELRTDLYTLGLILYEALTGLVPFDIHDAAEAYEKHLHVAPRQPSALRPEIPEALEEVVLTCLAKSPDDRYPDAAALEAALQGVLNGLMPAGPEPTVRLAALPAPPPRPAFQATPRGPRPRLVVFDEQGTLLRDEVLGQAHTTLGRAPDNTVILDHAAVSRHQLILELAGGQAFVTDLTDTNVAYMDGLPLAPRVRLSWPMGSAVYLRPYWLQLLGPEAAKPARPRILVRPEHAHLTLVPGVPTVLSVLLANTGDTVDHFQPAVEGIPADWLHTVPGEVQLMPGTQTSTSLTFLVPKRPDSHARDYAATVLARSRENRAQAGSAPLGLTVTPFQDLTARLTPSQRRTWRRTSYTLELQNCGNAAQVLTAQLQDPGGDVRWLPRPQDVIRLDQFAQTAALPRALDPTQLARQLEQQTAARLRAGGLQAGQQLLRGEGRIRVNGLAAVHALEAGETVTETLKVQVPLRWVGATSQHRFSVDFQDAQAAPDMQRAEAPVAHAEAQLQHTPLISLALLPVLVVLIGLLIWWLTLPPVINQFALDGTNIRVKPGQAFALRWDTQRARSVRVIELRDQGRELQPDGTLAIPQGIQAATQYTLEARNLIGTRRLQSLTVETGVATPVIKIFSVKPASVGGNQKVTVTWKVEGDPGTTVSITGLGNQLRLSGSQQFLPTRTMTLQLVARNGRESASDQADVTVIGTSIQSFRSDRDTLIRGQQATLFWDVGAATEVKLDGQPVKARGTRVVSPPKTRTYTLTARGIDGSRETQSVQVEVTAPAPSIVSLTGAGGAAGSAVKVSWRTLNATQVSLQLPDGTSRMVEPNGTLSVMLPPMTADGDVQVILIAGNADGQSDTRSQNLHVTGVDPSLAAQVLADKQAQAAAAAAAAAEAADERQRSQLIKFTANPASLQGPGDVTLEWDAPGFRTVRLVGLYGPVNNGLFEGAGSTVVKQVTRTQTFKLQVTLTRQGKPEVVELRAPVVFTPLPPEIRQFQVTPSSLDAPGEVTLQWDVANASRIRLKSLPGPLAQGFWRAAGQTTVKVKATTTFTLTVGNQSRQQVVTVKAQSPVVRMFSVNPKVLSAPQRVQLRWDVLNAGSVTIEGVPGPNADSSWPPKGQTDVPVSRTTTFVLRAGGVTQTTSVVLTTRPNPAITAFTASPSALNAPGQTVLSWNAVNVKSVVISGVRGPNADGSFPPKGQTAVTVTSTRDFELRAGALKRRLTVAVRTAPPPAPVIQAFHATPSVLNSAQTVELTWKVANASTIVIEGLRGPNSDGSWPASGRTTVTVAATTPFTLRAGSVTRQLTVTVTPLSPRIISFTASPPQVTAGTPVTLRWSVINAKSVAIPGVAGTLPPNGSVQVVPASSRSYTLQAGDIQRQLAVVVTPLRPQITAFTAAATSITQGESVTLSWKTTGISAVKIDGLSGNFDPVGSTRVTPSSSTTYVLHAGSASKTVTITVSPQVQKAGQIISFKADTIRVFQGDPVTLTWQTSGTDSVRIDGVATRQPPNGSLKVFPVSSRTITLYAGDASESINVTVDPKAIVGPVEIIKFEAFPNPVPPGADVTIRWEVRGVSGVQIKGLQGRDFLASGSRIVNPTETITLTLKAGDQTRELEIEVLSSSP